MRIFCTYCSKDKDGSAQLLPAYLRYLSPRIDKVYKEAKAKGLELFILSGKFGLIHSDTKIPDYNQLLKFEEVTQIIKRLSVQLTNYNIDDILYYTKSPDQDVLIRPYLYAIEIACGCNNVGFQIEII